jgi:hypothetical protein
MNLNFSLCGKLCENIDLSNLSICKDSRKKLSRASRNTKEIIKDINILLEDLDRNYICNHILNKLVQITGSEYGFLGKIEEEKGERVLYTYAITNIAWNASSQEFFLNNINNSLKFTKMNSFVGDVINSGKYKIVNKYDYSRNILPKGHPFTKRFLGVPSMFGNKPVAMLGVCNKLDKYTKKDVENVSLILNILSYLFIDLSAGHSKYKSEDVF